MAVDVDRGRRGHTLPGVGLVVGAVVVLSTIPACSSAMTPTSSPTSSSAASSSTPPSTAAAPPTFPQGSAALVDDCESDAKVVEVALEAYMAERGSYPTPPSPWSAANYVANFAPMTSAAAGGPYMHTPPATGSYVIEYDAAGHVWVAPPATYGATYNAAQDFDTNPDSCLAAIR